jgi:ABC-type polysaccharide/polyol phosphate export permease
MKRLTEIEIFRDYYPIWSYLSLQDLKSRFRRSRLGAFWIVMQQLGFSLGAGYIWAKVFGLDPADFIPFIALGFAIWGFLTAAMTEGGNAFIIAHNYLKQLPLPQSLFIFRTLATQLVTLSIGFTTAIMILVAFWRLQPLGLLYCLPGIAIALVYGYGAIGTMAYLGLRYRDLPHALAMLFNLLFVVTPVIYPPETLIKKGLHLVIFGNPFASLIEVIRAPLLSGALAELPHYFIASAFAMALVGMRFYLANKWERFVPFWS